MTRYKAIRPNVHHIYPTFARTTCNDKALSPSVRLIAVLSHINRHHLVNVVYLSDKINCLLVQRNSHKSFEQMLINLSTVALPAEREREKERDSQVNIQLWLLRKAKYCAIIAQ